MLCNLTLLISYPTSLLPLKTSLMTLIEAVVVCRIWSVLPILVLGDGAIPLDFIFPVRIFNPSSLLYDSFMLFGFLSDLTA